MLDRLNALWFGARLSYLEQLSIKSALACGHSYTLYSYQPDSLAGVPAGVELRDAREVMTDPRRMRFFDGEFKALGADFFRYEMLAQGRGYWVDLDLIFFKPLDFTSDYVFGWESEKSINQAVLKLPAGSEALEALRAIPDVNWCPPFFGPRRRFNYYMKRLRGNVRLEELPWGVTGPEMITYLTRKHDLAERAQPKEVFYPLEYYKAHLLFEPASVVEAIVTPQTRTIHMWHSRLRELARRPPPQGSYIDLKCREHEVAT